jgi:hypothetical protein
MQEFQSGTHPGINYLVDYRVRNKACSSTQSDLTGFLNCITNVTAVNKIIRVEDVQLR